jgi:hypothetical protein
MGGAAPGVAGRMDAQIQIFEGTFDGGRTQSRHAGEQEAGKEEGQALV